MTDSQRLLAELMRASKLTGLQPSTLGKRILKNGTIHKRLKAGKIVYPKTAAKLRKGLALEIERRKKMQ